MAYAFGQTMNALGLTNGEEETPSSNVFGEQATQNNASPQAAQSSGTTLANTEGDSTSGAGGSSAGSPNSTAPNASPIVGGKNRVMSANAGKAQAPADFNKITSSISGARQDIQNKSNAYVQNAGNDYNDLSNQAHNNVADYASGKQPEGQTNWFTQYRNAPTTVDPLKIDTNTTIPDVDMLGTDAGINQLFRRGQDAEGSLGEAALDTALLRKSQPFQVQRDETLSNYKNLQNEKIAAEQDSPEKAQAVRNAASNEYKNKVNSEAGGLANQYEDQAKQKEQQFDAVLAALGQSQHGNLKGDAQKIIDQMKSSGNYDPLVSKYLDTGDNLDPYFTAGKTAADTKYTDFYDQGSASGFNNIMGLLGKGGDLRSAGSLAGVDPNAYLGGGILGAGKTAFTDSALKRATLAAQKERDNTDATDAKVAAIRKEIADGKAQDEAAAAKRKTSASAEDTVDSLGSAMTNAGKVPTRTATGELHDAATDPGHHFLRKLNGLLGG